MRGEYHINIRWYVQFIQDCIASRILYYNTISGIYHNHIIYNIDVLKTFVLSIWRHYSQDLFIPFTCFNVLYDHVVTIYPSRGCFFFIWFVLNSFGHTARLRNKRNLIFGRLFQPVHVNHKRYTRIYMYLKKAQNLINLSKTDQHIVQICSKSWMEYKFWN